MASRAGRAHILSPLVQEGFIGSFGFRGEGLGFRVVQNKAYRVLGSAARVPGLGGSKTGL